jgi:RNA polymerase sigma factor (sigma-70 family)
MSQNIEHDWVERARRGEPAAIAELYRRYWRAARAAAYGVTGDLSLAEDAASEAFSAAMSGLADLRDTQRFGPWLRTIVIRTARRMRTASSARKGIEPQALADTEAAAPGENLEQQELAALIREAVASLPAILREAISLFYFEGYSVEDAARFLGVPAGTLKRRLHDGRQRLQSAAEHILNGRNPMDPEREQILRQIREAAEEGLNSDAFYQVIRKSLNLRPVPRELLQVMRKHYEESIRKRGQAPLLSPEQERVIREGLRQIHEPSERARDPNHPVGAAANAIREALPEFRLWQVDISQIDLSERARQLLTDRAEGLSYLLPPDFAEESSDAYVSAERALLIKDEDGSVVTFGELMRKKATQEAFREQMKAGACMSDALGLLWKQLEPMDLRAVEELLRRLAEQVVPGTSLRFSAYEEPRYRAALRMQLGDNPIPAAIGGVLDTWQGLPQGLHVASVTIYLEPWASARSGEVIELTAGTPFPSLKQKTSPPNNPSE